MTQLFETSHSIIFNFTKLENTVVGPFSPVVSIKHSISSQLLSLREVNSFRPSWSMFGTIFFCSMTFSRVNFSTLQNSSLNALNEDEKSLIFKVLKVSPGINRRSWFTTIQYLCSLGNTKFSWRHWSVETLSDSAAKWDNEFSSDNLTLFSHVTCSSWIDAKLLHTNTNTKYYYQHNNNTSTER